MNDWLPGNARWICLLTLFVCVSQPVSGKLVEPVSGVQEKLLDDAKKKSRQRGVPILVYVYDGI